MNPVRLNLKANPAPIIAMTARTILNMTTAPNQPGRLCPAIAKNDTINENVTIDNNESNIDIIADKIVRARFVINNFFVFIIFIIS